MTYCIYRTSHFQRPQIFTPTSSLLLEVRRPPAMSFSGRVAVLRMISEGFVRTEEAAQQLGNSLLLMGVSAIRTCWSTCWIPFLWPLFWAHVGVFQQSTINSGALHYCTALLLYY